MSVYVMGYGGQTRKQGATLTQGEKTYLPVALHRVCHLNKSQASTVRSGEVLGQWEKENLRIIGWVKKRKKEKKNHSNYKSKKKEKKKKMKITANSSSIDQILGA